MQPPRHILREFDRALDALRSDALMMASLTDRNLQNAMSCLLDRNVDLCAVTIMDEKEVDALEKKSTAMASRSCSGSSRLRRICGRSFRP